MEHISYSMLMLNSHFDLVSPLPELQSSIHRAGDNSPNSPFVSAFLQGYYSFQSLLMPHMGESKDRSPSREPRMVEKLVVYFSLIFLAFKVRVGGKFSTCSGPGRMRRGRSLISLGNFSEFFSFLCSPKNYLFLIFEFWDIAGNKISVVHLFLVFY